MKTRINPIGGRWSPWIGSILLVNFAVVCALKIIHGMAGDILWMSHLGLLIAGIGFVRRSTVVVCTALIGIGVFHGIWLVDCLTWLFSGVWPLGVTSYLQGADMSVWAATAHHFYLAPLLVAMVWRHKDCPKVSLVAAIGLFLLLSVLSRAFLTPAENVNYAFRVETDLDWKILEWANNLPAVGYLLMVNVFVSVVFFVPTHAMLWYCCAARLSAERRTANIQHPTSHTE